MQLGSAKANRWVYFKPRSTLLRLIQVTTLQPTVLTGILAPHLHLSFRHQPFMRRQVSSFGCSTRRLAGFVGFSFPLLLRFIFAAETSTSGDSTPFSSDPNSVYIVPFLLQFPLGDC